MLLFARVLSLLSLVLIGQFKAGKGAVFNCTQPGLIALTFDDGPGTPGTHEVLDVLKKYGVKATFFINGLYNYETDFDRYKATISRIHKEGHQLGSHGWDHVDLSKLSQTELKDNLDHLAEVVRLVAGVNMTVFRPPLGEFTQEMEAFVEKEFGYSFIMWNVDTRDWENHGDINKALKHYQDFFTVNNETETVSAIGLHHDPLQGSAAITEATLEYLMQITNSTQEELPLKVVSISQCIGKQMYISAPGNDNSGNSVFISSTSLFLTVSFALGVDLS